MAASLSALLLSASTALGGIDWDQAPAGTFPASSGKSSPLSRHPGAPTPAAPPSPEMREAPRGRPSGPIHADGVVLVKFKKGSPSEQALQRATAGRRAGLSGVARETWQELLGDPLIEDVQPAFRVSGVPGARQSPLLGVSAPSRPTEPKREDLFRWCRLAVRPGVEVATVVESLRQHRDVECVEPNYLRRLAAEIPPPITGLPDATTDPGYDEQWHLTATRTPMAWNHLKENGLNPGGSRDVIVAVIDTGVDAEHEDLVANIWTNAGEVAGNGIDDDGNGFVDDIHGCSVVSDPRSHSGDSSDYFGHGTHVAGIIAGTAFNHAGGVGVAFNVQVMSVRAAQYSGVLTALDVAEAVLYAIDNGAEVINMSFGGYLRSQIEEDALEVALSQAMLVAAAGNDGVPSWVAPMYPAALHYVHGVMATTPTGQLAWFSNSGYDMAAPGVSIYSTLPGNDYAKWSGTSMATPVIAGIGALMRSFFWQRDIYSVRFLMGGLWASGGDAYIALTVLPTPGVTVLENWLFDDTGIDSDNDGDGRVDSGETLHLGIELINRAGQADNVIAYLEARAEGAVMDDPYVTIDVPLVDFGPIGPFNTLDNGFIYDAEGVIVGVQQPFVFTVSPDCPNDHVIEFQLTVDFQDGWDPEKPWYTRISRFNYIVQRGKNVPTVIPAGTTFTLTANEYWMVAGPVLVEPGATLNVEPGTSVQWGSVSDDPYNPGPQTGYVIVRGTLNALGTAEHPISMFPSYLVTGQNTRITVETGGVADLEYAQVRNPELAGLRQLDHCYLNWDAFSAAVSAKLASHTIFHRLRGGTQIDIDRFVSCLFDASWMPPKAGAQLYDCVFLQDPEMPIRVQVPCSLRDTLTTQYPEQEAFFLGLQHHQGSTYVLLPMEWPSLPVAELLASYYGGHTASVPDAATETFLQGYLDSLERLGIVYYFVVGLTDEGAGGALTGYHWLDGSPMNFSNWASGYPLDGPHGLIDLIHFGYHNGTGVEYGWKNMPEASGYRFAGSYHSWRMFLWKLPGELSMEQLLDPVDSGELLAYVRTHHRERVRRNAFLNRYWDPVVTNWLRVQAPGAMPHGIVSLQDNYWGTDSTTLIDHLILDYYDDFTSARIDYKPPPAQGYESTYPFAQQVLIDGVSAETVPVLETGLATFRLTFNRDMDPSVEPFVTFGPSAPYTDFQVKPRDENFLELPSGWVDARTWEGKAYITPVTGNGYHMMRVSGAVAASDPWLVTGYDVARFRFKVQTVEVAAMTLQASGREGRIDLSWQQNDYDLLAGYNLYRAAAAAGPFTQLNATVIPPGQESYVDYDIVPAVSMFYRFTVVTTDFQESDPSNLASAAATDTIPPVLVHAPVVAAVAGRGLRINAEVTDNVHVASVRLRYRAAGGGGGGVYSELAMINASGDIWSATLPASAMQPPGVEYYLVASDGLNQVLSGTAAVPHLILIENQPVISSVTPSHGPATGGTPVTLAGTQFQTGATVRFGEAEASGVTVISPNQITCLTPAHYPAQADVSVVNPDNSRASLLNGYRFEATEATLSLPVTAGDYGTVTDVALSADNLTGLRAAEIVVVFDPAVVTAVGASAGPLLSGWSLVANVGVPGRIMLTLAGTPAISGAGVMATLRFNVVGTPPASTALTIQSATLNDGALTTQASHGLFAVKGLWTVSGTATYYSGGGPVPGVELHLLGGASRQTTSDTAGEFTLEDLPTASYTLSPEKHDDAGAITALDASLVLQHAAGLLTLSPLQLLAADVNRNALVTAMDATYILDRAVDLIDLPFPGAGRVWDFEPQQRSYALLAENRADQHFTALLIGDVSGNWAPPDGGGLLGGGEREAPPAALAVKRLPRGGANASRWLVLVSSPRSGFHGVDLELAGADVSEAEVHAGPLGQAMLLASNVRQPGRLRVAAAGAFPVQGIGSLLVVSLGDRSDADLRLVKAVVDENRVPARIDATGAAFETDTDGDRHTDWEEVQAGTDPLDPTSRMMILGATPEASTRVVVRWSAVAGRRYQLQAKDDLRQAAWGNVGPAVTAAAATCTQTDAGAGGSRQRLYRVTLAE